MLLEQMARMKMDEVKNEVIHNIIVNFECFTLIIWADQY